MTASITKENSKALWHAVQAMQDMHEACRDLHAEGKLTAAQVVASGQRLARAKVALRKVQAISRNAITTKPPGAATPKGGE